MSYDQTFRGVFEYPDAHHLEAGIDAFVARLGDTVVDLSDLKIDGLTIAIDQSCSAPAGMYEETQIALRELGHYAASGWIDTTFVLDGTSHDHVGAGNAHPTAPRHRRWEVFFAAKRGDAAALRELARAGVALAQSFPGYRGYSTLHLAAESGSTECVQLLLDAGVDPNIARDPDAPTPLMVASSVDIVRQLVAAGADLERRMLGFTAIVRACKRDDVASARALLDAGATLPEDCFDQIAHACARHGNVALLRTLLEREPRLASALAAEDVMQAAIRSGESVLVDLLLQHGAVLPDTLLEDAVRAGSVALVETALRAPGAVAACGSSADSWDPMCVAARTGNLALLELLARHGIPVHPTTPGKTSPLHEAVQARSEAAVTWLLDRGAPVNAATATGTTVFRHAIEHAPIEILALLSRRGADTTGVTEALTPAGRSKYYELGGEVTAPPEPPQRARKRKRR